MKKPNADRSCLLTFPGIKKFNQGVTLAEEINGEQGAAYSAALEPFELLPASPDEPFSAVLAGSDLAVPAVSSFGWV